MYHCIKSSLLLWFVYSFVFYFLYFGLHLYILTQTDPVSILVECFFCDSKEDYQRGDEAHEKDLIARKIAEGILNQELPSLFELKSEGFKNGSYIGRRARVTANVLNVRYDRGTQYNAIDKLNKDDNELEELIEYLKD